MSQHRWNWYLCAGFVLCLVGFASMPVLARFQATRDVPWVNFLLFGAGLAFLFVGLRRAFGQPQQYRGKIAGTILGALSVLIVGIILFRCLLSDSTVTGVHRSAKGRREGS